MGLKNVFLSAVNSIFSVLNDAVQQGQYIVVTDNGFDDVTETPYDVRVILDNFTQKDVEYTSFYDLIQPTDVKGLVPGEDIPVSVNTSDRLRVGDRDFAIVAFETDPMNALFTLLLRDTK